MGPETDASTDSFQRAKIATPDSAGRPMALPADLLLFVLGTIVAAFFVHLAAAFALGGTPIWRAALIAALGNLLGFLLFLFFRDFSVVGNTIMVVSWLAIT